VSSTAASTDEDREPRKAPALAAVASTSTTFTTPGPAVGSEALLLRHPHSTRRPERSSRSESRGRDWLTSRLLLLADVFALALAGAAAWLLTDRQNLAGIVFLAAVLPLWPILFRLTGLYALDARRADHSTADEIGSIFHTLTFGAFLLLAASATVPDGALAPRGIVILWLVAVPMTVVGRGASRAVLRRHATFQQNTVIVGSGAVGQRVARKILNHPELGLRLLGFVDADMPWHYEELEGVDVLGDIAELPDLVRELAITRVIIAFSTEGHDAMLGLVRELSNLDVHVDVVPRLFEAVGADAALHGIEGVPLIAIPPFRLSAAAERWKRGFDLVVAGASVLCLFPLFLAIGIAIRLDTPGPVFFRQRRVGRHGRTFRIVKFRTMVADAEDRKQSIAHLNVHARAGGDPRMFKAENDPRVTRVGRMLRATRLDELPQLVNVLRGEMSIVGPRPLIPSEDRHVRNWQRRRLDLKPGITGLWQALGASRIPFEEMVKLDYLYVKNWSLLTDVKLMLRTVAVLLRTNGD
jgi:exopolysaccharide biosynthesis polyprenyl glycosylphosphotransferase